MKKEEVVAKFNEIYGDTGSVRLFHSPGRVNLIGEHTDCHGGYVFPCALDFGTYAAVSLRDDNIVSFASTNFVTTADVDLTNIAYDKAHDWANYPKGVIKELLALGYTLGGLNILISGNIPNGAGLSSSASLEVLTGVIFNEIFGLSIDMVEIVKMSQRAENYFIGVMCGIMDQFAVGMGKADNAILLNCKSLKYEYAPLILDGRKIVIANTNKQRKLQQSAYNDRRADVDRAVTLLKQEHDIEFLCDLTLEQFDKSASLITDDNSLKRAKHIVYENERTLRASKALKDKDLKLFGELLNESHKSLKEYYEVTGKELDCLAENAQKFDGCLGARMTGAGFGGCTVSIVEDGKIPEFIEVIGAIYTKETGLVADFYIANAGDGANEVHYG